MTEREGQQRPAQPVYLSRVPTAEAELSIGQLYDGSSHSDNAVRAAAALVFVGGDAMLLTETDDGQITRLRIPGPEFLRLADDAAGRLARSIHQPRPAPAAKEHAMAVLESPGYQAARERLEGNPVIAMMAAGVAAVPLLDLAHEDGTPRAHLMNQANRAFDDAEARNAGSPVYAPYPKDAHRHLGLIAEAVLAERAAIRTAVADTMAPPSTDPESAAVTAIIERARAGEPGPAGGSDAP